ESHSPKWRAVLDGVSSSHPAGSAASTTGTCAIEVAAVLPGTNADACRSSRQPRARTSGTAGPARGSTLSAEESSIAAPHPAHGPCQPESATPGAAGALRSSQRSGRTPSTSVVRAAATQPSAGKGRPRRAASALSTWVRSRRAASSMTSAATGEQVMPAGASAAVRLSGPDTHVLRIEHVRAEDLKLHRLLMDGRAGEQPLPKALATTGEQRESHPAFELDRRSGGGEVAKTHIGGLTRNELTAVAQTLAAIGRADTDQLQ